MPKNANCSISDSSLCRWINKSCDKCYISDIRKEGQIKEYKDNFEVTMSLLPPDFDELQSDECQFCIGEKGKRSGYASIDFAHSEPESETGMFFGFGKKVRRRVGSMIIASISICRGCRRAMFIAGMLKWLMCVVGFAIAAGILTIPGVGASLDVLISLCILVLSAYLGYLAGTVISNAYIKAKKNSVRFDVFDIPVCAKMKDKGWFLMQDSQRFIFSKKPQIGKLSDIIKESCGEDDVVQTSFFKD